MNTGGEYLPGGIIGNNENDYGDEEEAGQEGEGGSGFPQEAESKGEDPGGGGITG